jgi:hypothetical protein
MPKPVCRLLYIFFCRLFNDSFSNETAASDGRITDNDNELERTWKEALMA